MIIGIPKEIKNNEYRVGLTPSGAFELVKKGHKILIEQGAGIGSGFDDEAYKAEGAEIIADPAEVYARSEMIIKVKEPIESEYKMIQKGQLVFTYFHFASNKELTLAMIASGAVCLAYETVEKSDRSLPLLIPMSEVAGRSSVPIGMNFLLKSHGGKGLLLSGVPGVKSGKVLILGGGVVGYNAALSAAGVGAEVVLCDISLQRLRYLDSILPANVRTQYASEFNIRKELPNTDLVIGAVLIPGGRTPHLITRDMLPLMEEGSVIVDVAIDQGGCIESSRPTSHDDPTFVEQGIVHCCVANIPGAFAQTSTLALTNATLPYAIDLAGKGWKKACEDDSSLQKGLNIVEGKIVYPAVAEAWGL